MPSPRDTQRRIAARGKAFQAALTRWMLRVAREEAQSAVRSARVRKKAVDEELIDLLMRYGLAQLHDGAGLAASTRGLESIIDPQSLRAILASKEFRIQVMREWRKGAEVRAEHIGEETRKLVRESVGRILQDAAEEDPRPSVGEIARRIRTQFHGPEDGRVFAFSPERAALIARTELAQAENSGIVAGYDAAGVETIEWMAFTDGRSGDRHHEEMNGVQRPLGELFQTPLGNFLRYPADPEAPIADTANCRCTTRAVIL